MAPSKIKNQIPRAIKETKDNPGKISNEQKTNEKEKEIKDALASNPDELQKDNENSDSCGDDSDEEEEVVESENGHKRKRGYHYNPYQITQLDTFYNEFPAHRREQREELARELGLDHKQVKFWLRNKRKHECEEQNAIRGENERLKRENREHRYRLAIANSSAASAARSEDCLDRSIALLKQLRLENSILREEINRKKMLLAWIAKAKGAKDD